METVTPRTMAKINRHPRNAQQTASTAVERALGILEAVADCPAGLTNAEVSQRLKIPKSSASYILRTLEQRGYLRRDDETGKYRLGLKVVSLQHGALLGLDVRALARPVLRHLVERAHLTAHLAILDKDEVIYIERVEAPGFVKMDTWVGRRMAVHCTSVGKALVAHLPRKQVEQILPQHGLRRHTPRTVTSRARFWQELEKVRARGYAVDDEENNLGVRCVAAPVFDSEGNIAASVGVSGTTSQIDRHSLPHVAELVRDAARNISRQLGYRPPPRRP